LEINDLIKKLFQEVLRQTRKYKLTSDASHQFVGDEEFRNRILSKIKDPYHQLCLQIRTDKTANNIPACSLRILKALKLGNSSNVLEFLSNRKFLSISSNNIIDSLIGLANIHKLEIRSFMNLESLSFISNLQELEVRNCKKISDLSMFSNLFKIRISFCPNIKSLNGLGKVHILEILNCLELTDISALTSDNYSLSIHGCFHIENIQPIYQIKELETDLIQEESHFPPAASSSSSQFISPLEKLGMNFASRLTSLTSISPLFPHLMEIKLYHCQSLENVHGLSTIPYVNIQGCANLEDLSGLGYSGHCNRFVMIERCYSVTSFQSLKSIPTVKILSCPTLKNGEDLSEVKHLTVVNCPLRDLLMFGQCKSVTLIEIPVTDCLGLYHVPVVKLVEVNPYSSSTSDGLGGNQRIVLNRKLFEHFRRRSGFALPRSLGEEGDTSEDITTQMQPTSLNWDDYWISYDVDEDEYILSRKPINNK
jgi:hypothetical protein